MNAPPIGLPSLAVVAASIALPSLAIVAAWLAGAAVLRRRTLTVGPPPYALLAGVGLAAGILLAVYPQPRAIALAAASPIIVVAAVVDARTGLLLDIHTIAVLIIGVLGAVVDGGVGDDLRGLAFIGVAMVGLWLLTARRGIGLGDVKFATAIAACLGTSGATLAIGAAFVFGAVVGGARLVTGSARRGDVVHFGPYLAVGALMSGALRWPG